MNLRQKTKKLKAENEALKKLSSPFSKPLFKAYNLHCIEPKQFKRGLVLNAREYRFLKDRIDEYMLNVMLADESVKETLKKNLKVEIAENFDCVKIIADLTLYN